MIHNSMLHATSLNKEESPEHNRDYWNLFFADQPFEQYELPLGAEISRGLPALAGRCESTMDSIVHSVWAVLLSRYNDAGDITFEVAGMRQAFPEPVAIGLRLDEKMSFREWTRSVGAETELAAARSGLNGENRYSQGLAGCDFHVRLVSAGDQLTVKLVYNSSVYAGETARQAARHLRVMIAAVAANPDIALRDIGILTEEEKEELRHFNGASYHFPAEKSIHHLVEEQAAAGPERIALIFEEEKHTYGEVNGNANRLAHWMIGQGIGGDKLVAILMQRGPRMAESILAVWKAGGAYIPLDPAYPAERISDIIGSSGCSLVLTDTEAGHSSLFANAPCPAVNLDSLEAELENCASGNPGLPFDSGQLSYVIYTSGSTGKPKGAMVEHLGMMNHLYAKINDLAITGSSIVVQNASHCFDISVWQFFSALAAGGTTLIYPNDLAADPDFLIDSVIADKASVLEVVPSYLSVMLEFLETERRAFPDLRKLVVTGEALKQNVVKRWFALYPAIPVVNAYGPTEASDDITHHVMNEAPQSDTIPVGRPLHNFHIYIVDREMRLCPIGVKGEICVSGIGVGRGYLHDPARTEAVFMNDPFAEESGRRLYKTGDLGRWLPGGIIEFFGRKDYQVKIRGFRIELGEIENKLVNHPDVHEAVVIDLEDELGTKYLCAYLVGRAEIDIESVKAHLSQQLPYYMVPSQLIRLDKMPVTSNGKVDRNALPKPQAMALV